MVKYALLIVGFMSVFVTNIFADDNKLSLLTEQNPPFNYVEKGKIKGITVSTLEEMFKGANLPFSQQQITLDNWSTVFSQAITTPNALLFTASRTKEREHLFQWIGPIADIQLAIIAPKKNAVKIKEAKNLKHFKVATVKNASPERAFVNAGGSLKDVFRVSTYKQAYKMLGYGRVDAIVVDDLPFFYWLIQNGKKLEDYEVVLNLENIQYYIIANKQVPKETVAKLQNELDKLKKVKNGTSKYQQILDIYFKN